MLRRWKVDICCLQETGWSGCGTLGIGEYKFMWNGGRGGKGGVGVAVAKKWENDVVEVRWVDERIVVVKVAVGEEVLNVVSVYAPQSGRTEEEKGSFYDALDDVMAGVGEERRLLWGVTLTVMWGRRWKVLMACMEDMDMGRGIRRGIGCWSLPIL